MGRKALLVFVSMGMLTASLVVAGPAAAAKRPKCFGQTATIIGTNGVDSIRGTNRADVIVAKGGDDEIVGRGGNDRICAGEGVDRVSAGGGADVVSGATGFNTLNGDGGNDRLVGGPEIDFIFGGPGNDTVTGGDGQDSLDYRSSTAGVVVDLAAGTSSGTADGNDTASSFERVLGSDFQDDITGSPANETFFPNGGDDDVDGGGGLDLVSYVLAPGPVDVDLQSGSATGSHGTDSLSNGIVGVRGSDFADVLKGGNEMNDLIGGPGNDRLEGRAGSDYIIPGAGDDTIDGGPDSLTNADLDSVGDSVDYFDAPAGVNVDLAAGTVTGGDGNDNVTNVEFVIGSTFDDVLRGSARDNEGFAGEDGNDVIDGRGGILDTADYSFAPGPVTVDLAAGTATGNGNDTLIGVEWVFGSAFDDILSGAATDDVLFGGDGNDTLDGRAGQDVLRGGEGTDTCSNGETSQTCEA